MGSNPSRIRGSPYLSVDCVSWEDAMSYCRKLTALERKAGRLPEDYEFRLPTEAEWEYACRAGSKEEFSVLAEAFWFQDSAGWKPHEVGELPPNPWGLYDMHGNAFECTYDAWHDYPKNAIDVLVDPVRWGRPERDRFILRGGAWWWEKEWATSHARHGHLSIPAGYRGFRLALGPVIPRS